MKRRTTVALLGSLLVLLLSGVGILAQETTGSIDVTAKDATGAVVPSVAITVSSTSGAGFKRTVATDDEGSARVLQVPPGNYTVVAAATAGFVERTVTDVIVALGKTTSVQIKMETTVAASVTVSGGEVQPIDVTDNKIQTTISAETADLLPKGPNFTSVLKISPGTRSEPRSGQFQIDGASGSENTFIVDGQEVTNVRTGVLDANSNLPFSQVEEVQVKSSSLQAEYGGATGGVINVVTKGGGNEFHGEFGTKWSPSGVNALGRPILFLNANSNPEYFDQKRDAYLEILPTASIRGPIIKDHLWFSADYSPQIFRQNRTINYVDRFNRTTVTFPSQTYTYRSTDEKMKLRIDGQPFGRLRLTGTYNYNPIHEKGTIPGWTTAYFNPVPGVCQAPSCQAGNPALNGAAFLNQTGGRQNSQSVTGGGTWFATNKLTISGRVGHYFLNEKLGSYGYGDVTRSRVLCSASSFSFPAGFGCAAGQNNGVTAFTNTVYDATERNTYDADATYMFKAGGQHELKGGYQQNQIGNSVDSRFSDQIVLRGGWTIAQYSGNSTLLSTPGAVGAGLLRVFQTQGNVTSKNEAVFIQDRWQPISWLTLNLGLRTERENVPTFTAGLPGIKFDFQDKMAPRLGVAIDLTRDGKTKLGAFYGWFYDRFKYELPRGSFGGDIFHDFYYEILPGDTLASFQSRAQIWGTGTYIPGGRCPAGTTTPVFGRVRCDIDYRVPSNSGLPLTEAGGIDPNIKAFRQSELSVTFDRELFSKYIFGVRFTHKAVDHAVEDAGFPNAEGSEFYIIGNPGEGLYAQTAAGFGLQAPKPERTYDALEVRFDRNFADDFFFGANYTLSRLYGNYSGLASSDEDGRLSPNVNRYFDQPQAGFTVAGGPDNGRLSTDRPHVFKFYGTYRMKWDRRLGFGKGNETDFTVFTTAESGTPVTSIASVNGLDSIVLTKRGDLGRTPLFTQTDLGVHHRYRFGKDGRFAIVGEIDLLNAFNTNTVTNRINTISQLDYDVRELIPAATQSNCDITGNQQPCLIAGYKIFQKTGSPGFVTTASDPTNRYNLYNFVSARQGPRTIYFNLRFVF